MQLIKFGLVGLLGTLVHYMTLIAGVQLVDLSATLASSIGFVLGAFCNHHFNRLYTFITDEQYLTTLVHFMYSASFLFVLNLVMMYLMTGMAGVHYIVAQLITTLVVFFAGFIINKTMVFRLRHTLPVDDPKEETDAT